MYKQGPLYRDHILVPLQFLFPGGMRDDVFQRKVVVVATIPEQWISKSEKHKSSTYILAIFCSKSITPFCNARNTLAKSPDLPLRYDPCAVNNAVIHSRSNSTCGCVSA